MAQSGDGVDVNGFCSPFHELPDLVLFEKEKRNHVRIFLGYCPQRSFISRMVGTIATRQMALRLPCEPLCINDVTAAWI